MTTLPAEFVRPDHGNRCFDAIPALVERLIAEGSGKVALVLVDGLGWRLTERHAEHPFLRRCARAGTIERWTAQFPSTTTAATATIHSGLPVSDHGLYEWFIYEPALDRLICPLMFSFAGDGERNTLLALGPERALSLLPDLTTIYRRLDATGVHCHAFQSDRYTPGTVSDIAFAGAEVHPFPQPAAGLAALAEVLAGPGPLYCFAYIDEVDAAAHEHGPGSAQVADRIEATLDSLEALAEAAAGSGAQLLVTADHGLVEVDPATTVYVNLAWPEIVGLLRTGSDGRPLAPAGSARDLFLHVRPGREDEVVQGLRDLLGERALVAPVRDLVADGLFGPRIGERLRDRLADVAVLARGGHTVWWYEEGRFAHHFRGHHGGLTADEMEIPLIRVAV
jgi:Type I phosphodiesterase / nucleotide pyrophosphatase